MGSSNSTEKEEKGGEWTACLQFYISGSGEWKKLQSHDQTIAYFRDELQAEKETIIFSEIRKFDLTWVPGWVGNWHEYTLVETTNWHWSFEKNSEGIFVQRSKRKDDVRCNYGGYKRKNADRPEGRSSKVSFGENILDAVRWIIKRGELSNTYHVFERNCHFFASLLYEAITQTSGWLRLSNVMYIYNVLYIYEVVYICDVGALFYISWYLASKIRGHHIPFVSLLGPTFPTLNQFLGTNLLLQ